jgi:hypothetical protein
MLSICNTQRYNEESWQWYAIFSDGLDSKRTQAHAGHSTTADPTVCPHAITHAPAEWQAQEQPSHDILETFKRSVVLVGTCLRRSRTCMWVVDFLNSNRLEAQAGAPYWKTVGVGVTGEVRDYFRIITINPSRLSVACVL